MTAHISVFPMLLPHWQSSGSSNHNSDPRVVTPRSELKPSSCLIFFSYFVDDREALASFVYDMQ